MKCEDGFRLGPTCPAINNEASLQASLAKCVYIGIMQPMMKNQMEKNMENEMETGINHSRAPP